MKNKGFTLIELLVVITIIGILATWSTAIYTSQIQKSRDATRLSSIKALQSSLEQAFWDLSYYPWATTITPISGVNCDQNSHTTSNIQCVVKLWYMWSLPKDPKAGQAGNWSALDYTYAVWALNWVKKQVYELSMWVEANSEKIKCWSWVDWWNDDNRYEIWMPKAGLYTFITPWSIGWNPEDVVHLRGPDTTGLTWNSAAGSIQSPRSCYRYDASPTPAVDEGTNEYSSAIFIRWNCVD